jgi:RNA polymerase sigma-70 factor (ECF subfamily)
MPTNDEDRIARCFRDDAGRAVASLARAVGDLTLAEDAVADAYVVALERWPCDGYPTQPSMWILTTARRRAIDRLRRERVGRAKLATLTALETASAAAEETDSDMTAIDDRLGLIFACCHPAINVDARVALTLKALGGLTVGEIADAFLVPHATMAQRLIRVKRKIRATNIPFDLPPEERLAERLDDVCSVIYLIFNEGYAPTSGAELVRADLCNEAVHLARMLAALMPQEPEVMGLLALLLYHDSRRAARTDADGVLVTLANQDRALWNRDAIAEADALVRAAARHRFPAPYQLEAAIASVHAHAATADDVDWSALVELYDYLRALAPSPIVDLNRAVAVAYALGPQAGTEALDALPLAELEGYHHYHVARADTLRRLGDVAGARTSYERALDQTQQSGERAHIEQAIAQLGEPPATTVR